MHDSLKKWIGYQFSSGSTTGGDYKQFQREMRTDLRCQAKANGLELHDFHNNHYEFTAVLRNPETNRFIHISIPDVRFWQDQWLNHVLYRRMKHDKDWTGEGNHYGAWKKIGRIALKLASEEKTGS